MASVVVAREKGDTAMKRSAMAVLFATFVGLAGAGPATAAPVTVSDTVPCTGIGPGGGCAVDSWEVRCTTKAQHVSIRLAAQGGRPYMAAVGVAPVFPTSGEGERAFASPGFPQTGVFHGGFVGSNINVLVVVKGENVPGNELPYSLKASCYSIVSNVNSKESDDGVVYLDDDPDPEDPDAPTPPGEVTKVLKGTAIIKKQDQ